MNHKVKIDGYLCKRCGHTWLPRNKEYEPEVCPKCKSAYWNREIKQKKVSFGTPSCTKREKAVIRPPSFTETKREKAEVRT